jgi:acyl carrier protein
VPADPGAGVPPADELRRDLARQLPDHLIPSGFVEIASIPTTSSGKVDHRALPDPASDRPVLTTAYAAPDSGAEEAIARIWTDVLGVERIGRHDDFFDLGGHSLLATQVVARIRAAFETELSVAELFDQPTVASLGQLIEARIVAELEQLSDDEAAQLLWATAMALSPEERGDGAV